MKIAIIISALALVGCSSAPKSSEVAPDYVSPVHYEAMSCDRLSLEEQALRRAVQANTAAVDKHRDQQTGVEVVTWVLFWPAAFFLDKGTEHSTKLARVAGELEALNAAKRIKKCGHEQQAKPE